MVVDQPRGPGCTPVWSLLQARVRLSISVRPPGAWGRTWWIWHRSAGTVQPGDVHPPSAAISARR